MIRLFIARSKQMTSVVLVLLGFYVRQSRERLGTCFGAINLVGRFLHALVSLRYQVDEYGRYHMGTTLVHAMNIITRLANSLATILTRSQSVGQVVHGPCVIGSPSFGCAHATGHGRAQSHGAPVHLHNLVPIMAPVSINQISRVALATSL